MREACATATRVLLASGLLALAGAVPEASAGPPTHAKTTKLAIDGYILPKVTAFEAAARNLAATAAEFCAAPEAAGQRQKLDDGFAKALSAWAEAEVIRVGPATRDGRAQKIAFWPDPRGAVDRQMRQALSEHREAMTQAPALAQESAAVQGFPALEILLADKAAGIGSTGEEGRYRCRVAVAIAENIAALAHEVADGWKRSGGWRDLMLSPGPANSEYPAAETAATDVFKSLTTSMQAMLEAQVRPLAGPDHAKETAKDAEKEKKAKAPSQPYHRLALSRAYLLAGLKGSRELYNAARLVEYFDRKNPDQLAYAQLIEMGFDKTASEIDMKVWDAAATPEDEAARTRAAHVVISMLGGARRVIATKLAPAAGISLGFNELDGD